jgi:hypothetical protein
MNSNYLFHQRMNGNQGLRVKPSDENVNKSVIGVNGQAGEAIHSQREFGKDITNTVNDGVLPLFSRKSLEGRENTNRNSFIDTKVTFSLL